MDKDTGQDAGCLADMTREAMRQALARAGGNVSLAAKQLGVNRSTIYRQLSTELARRSDLVPSAPL